MSYITYVYCIPNKIWFRMGIWHWESLILLFYQLHTAHMIFGYLWQLYCRNSYWVVWFEILSWFDCFDSQFWLWTLFSYMIRIVLPLGISYRGFGHFRPKLYIPKFLNVMNTRIPTHWKLSIWKRNRVEVVNPPTFDKW